MELGVQHWSYQLSCTLEIPVEKCQTGKWINKSGVPEQAKGCIYYFGSHWSIGREGI